MARSWSGGRARGPSPIGTGPSRTRARPLMSATRNDTHDALRLVPMLRVTAFTASTGAAVSTAGSTSSRSTPLIPFLVTRRSIDATGQETDGREHPASPGPRGGPAPRVRSGFTPDRELRNLGTLTEIIH